MKNGWKTWVTSFGAMASVVVLATTTCDPALFGSSEDPDVPELNPGGSMFIAWEDTTGDEAEQAKPPVFDPPTHSAYWMRLKDAQFPDYGRDAAVMVSAPGMYPFVSTTTESGGFLALPANEARRMDGQPLPFYELIARTEEGDQGFWGVVRGPQEQLHSGQAHTVRLREAHPMTVTVVDLEGEPVEGAFVRLSRDSVGLLHLHYTTEADGVAQFRGIVPGTYFLTLDADHHARQAVRVEHSGEQALTITLEEGRGVRVPESWRGPTVAEMVGEENFRPAQEQAAEEQGAQEMSQKNQAEGANQLALNVYAADERGGGVEGAWIEAWVGGERVAQAMSRGSQPVVLRVPAGEAVELVATHAGWGEGVLVLSAPSERDDPILRMSGPLLSASVARDRVLRVSAVEDALQAPLVADGRRWLVDHPDSDSKAAQAGLQRGDSLLFLRRRDRGFVAVVERGGRIVELSF